MRAVLLSILLLGASLAFSQNDVRQIDLPKGLYAFTFCEDLHGTVWIGLSDGDTNGDLGFFKDTSFTLVSGSHGIPSGSYHESLALPDGSLLFVGNVTNEKGQPVMVHVQTEAIDTIQIPIGLPDPFINCIALVNQSEIWIGSASGLIIGQSGSWKLVTQDNGLPSNVVTSISQDFRGIIWVATENGIVSFVNEQMVRPALGSRLITRATALHIDRQGYLWAGARFSAEGVSVYNGQLWETFSRRHGLAENSVSLFHSDSKGTLWVGSCPQRNRGGLSSFNGREWIAYEYPSNLAKPCVDAIANDAKGNIWVGGSMSTSKAKGISIFDGTNWNSIGSQNRLKAERVIKFFLDKKGQMWISALEGLFVLQPGFNFYK